MARCQDVWIFGPAGCCLALALAAGGPLAAQKPQNIQMVPPPEIMQVIERMGASASMAMARAYNITAIAGKSLAGSPPGRAAAKMLLDVPIGVHPTKEENEPTVAANPVDKKRVVAGSHFLGPPAPTANRCVAYTSSNRGASWSGPIPMPLLTPASENSDPVVVYAPDGSRVYYACMDVKTVLDFTFFPFFFTVTQDLDIVVSYSDDNGTSWTGPVIALNGDSFTITFTPCPSPPFPPGSFCGVITEPGFVYDKPWIGTHADFAQSNWVYVTATQFNAGALPYGVGIAFTRSSNKGVSWSAPSILDTAGGALVAQGSRPAGGVGGEVLVAWYHSDGDGWLNGGFQIRTRRSANNGATFNPIVIAAADSFEAPFWLGPFGFYKRWWGTMFPDVEIGMDGSAHIVYTHDPVAASATPEDGDVRYVWSAGPPYNSWSAPVTVNDDGLPRAQGYAALKLQYGADPTQRPHVHVIFEDTRLTPDIPLSDPADCLDPVAPGPCNSPNLFYDVFYARKLPGLPTFFSNVRVNEAASIQDFVFTGDYTDLAANSTLLYGVWTDRRDKTTIFDSEDDVFGSRIIAGGASP